MNKLPLTLTALLSLSAISQAATVASDNFASDGALAGQTGGTGWSGAWTGGNFTVTSGQALAGGATTATRLFNGGAITVGTNDTLTISFDLILAETFSGRGVGIQLLDSGGFDYYIGKRQNGSYGLHDNGGTGGADFASFASAPINQTITTVITYDGANTSFVLSDNNETLTAYSVAGQVTVDGIGIQTLHTGTNGNGIDNLSVDLVAVPEPSASVLIGLGGIVLIMSRRK
ncbi:PEP-CTERM sorting domain-containing protein [Rubritalea tangerina]|uniref:PEP-CTERM sorting domain-containing protein n=1 Tax=Rubritalea tangerina TaxID=430798 RepID=A0ABW4ZGB9_9BACT